MDFGVSDSIQEKRPVIAAQPDAVKSKRAIVGTGKTFPLQNAVWHGKLLPNSSSRPPRRFTIHTRASSIPSERCESGRIGQSRKLLSG
ncbi:protein of unknown function [Candidatus Nitrospira inopinata]|uniref:Uncharacterized protein n=1 Tax=Candidatus Nitrospira inopinata TaxID=1715989 RepID=A0A0S4KWV4_9BACT|nr:protein of unknown function [Candidatus Nitrospira inopinata]